MGKGPLMKRVRAGSVCVYKSMRWDIFDPSTSLEPGTMVRVANPPGAEGKHDGALPHRRSGDWPLKRHFSSPLLPWDYHLKERYPVWRATAPAQGGQFWIAPLDSLLRFVARGGYGRAHATPNRRPGDCRWTVTEKQNE